MCLCQSCTCFARLTRQPVRRETGASSLLPVQFVTRPFVVGDRVKLSGTGGGVILTGVVERIDPMRTCIRTDDSVPVAIPNKAITEMMVSNESRLGSSPVVQGFKVLG